MEYWVFVVSGWVQLLDLGLFKMMENSKKKKKMVILGVCGERLGSTFGFRMV